MTGKNHDVAARDRLVYPFAHGLDLIVVNVSEITGAMARQDIPDINEKASLVRIQANDDRVTRGTRRTRQLESLRNVRIRVGLAIQQFRLDPGQESFGVGAAPAYRMPARIGWRHQARLFRAALAVLADIERDELAFRERLAFRLVAWYRAHPHRAGRHCSSD